MSNMSYCRFQNTYIDLMDCVDALQEMAKGDRSIEDLSPDEANAADSMREACEEYLFQFGQAWENS